MQTRTRKRPRVAATADALPAEVAAALASRNLGECLARRGSSPEAAACWVEQLDGPSVALNAGELLQGATRAARGMQRHGLGAGHRVVIVLPTGIDFLFTYWGALLAGVTAVPAYPPLGLHQLDAFGERLERMAAIVDAKLVVVPEALRSVLSPARSNGHRLVTPEEILDAADDTVPISPAGADDLALIQFSSGSTGEPRAVCLTHRNILVNVGAFLARIRIRAGDVCVSWLPLYHDMGLIGTMMGAVLSGTPLVLIPPTDFLRRPLHWLEIMGRYRATISVAPQFAYNLCVRKAETTTLPDVDLSPLRVLLNGAEPIDAAGVAAFQQRFRPLGLRPGVVTPCYGLAEATLAAAMRIPGQRLRAVVSGAGQGATPSKVACVGRAMSDIEIGIRDERGAWLPDGKVGEICLRGPSVTSCYLGERGRVSATDRDGWLATGDLGFVDGGELFVTGRLKDLIIIGGRNLYPQDIEAAAAEVPGLRPGRVAAFGVTARDRATEALVLLAEVADGTTSMAATAAKLRQRLRDCFGVTPHDVVLLPRGQVPVTTSGKLRRSQARADYERGAFGYPRGRGAGATISS
jgi:acyl-CoA synthetase (AMP-forming)/AMP-acid ligase II